MEFASVQSTERWQSHQCHSASDWWRSHWESCGKFASIYLLFCHTSSSSTRLFCAAILNWCIWLQVMFVCTKGFFLLEAKITGRLSLLSTVGSPQIILPSPLFYFLFFRLSIRTSVCPLCIHLLTRVKVSWNARERHSGARKFKPGAFRLQNFWISQPELHSWAQQVSNLRYSNLIVNESFKFHIFTIINSQCWFYKIEKKQHKIILNTFIRSLIIWETAIEMWAQDMNGQGLNYF